MKSDSDKKVKLQVTVLLLLFLVVLAYKLVARRTRRRLTADGTANYK
jgi:hypothetical protein